MVGTEKLLHLLMTDYKVDSRVRNETESLVSAGYDVTVFCLVGSGLRMRETRERVKIVRHGHLIVKSRILMLLTGWVSMIFAAMKTDFRCVHAHDITALPVGLAIAGLKRVPLIYDSHELWSEAEHREYPDFLLKLSCWAERKMAKRANAIVTVSSGIADYLKPYFCTDNIWVLRNVPSYIHKGEYNIFREELGISQTTTIILYQGFISEERGVSYIADAIARLGQDRDYVMIFLGDGPYTERLRDRIVSENLVEKILVMNSVSQDQLLRYTSSADIGIHAIRNTCMNHDYCLPNKIFEYLAGGLAVVVTNLKEMTNLVEKNSVGLVFQDGDADDIAYQLAKLIDSPQILNFYKKRSQIVGRELNWVNEAKVLFSVYEEVLQ